MDAFCEAVKRVVNNPQLCETFSRNNVEDVKKYSVEKAVSNMAEIYKTVM